MAIKKLTALCVLLAFFCCGGFAADGQSRELVFAVWSDSHFGAYDFADTTRLKIIDQINGLGEKQMPQELEGALKGQNIDFMLHCGDITEKGEITAWNDPNSGDQRSYMRTIAHLKPEIKTYAVLGNHDSRKDVNIRENFKSLYGGTYYSFDAKGVHFVALDPYPQNNTAAPSLDKEQLDWLAADISKIKADMPVIITMHVLPIFNTEIDRSSRLDEESSKALGQIVEKKNVLAFLHGHWHRRSVKEFNGIPVIAPAGFAYSRENCKNGEPVIGIVHINIDKIENYSYDWDKEAFENRQFTANLPKLK